jgi:hypothetical protein
MARTLEAAQGGGSETYYRSEVLKMKRKEVLVHVDSRLARILVALRLARLSKMGRKTHKAAPVPQTEVHGEIT